VNCVKCGAELHEDQKVCIQCGTRTAAGGHFHVEEKQAWRPSKNAIYGAIGGALLLIIVIVAMSLRIVPPQTVAQQWFDSMVSRNYSKASRYHSEQFKHEMQTTMSDTQTKSEMIIDRLGGVQTAYTFGAPSTVSPGQVSVPVTFTGSDGQPGTITILLGQFGRKWLITGVAY